MPAHMRYHEGLSDSAAVLVVLAAYLDTSLIHEMLPNRATADSASGPDVFQRADGKLLLSAHVEDTRGLPTKSSL
jgi:hypothetical protein